MRAELGKVLAVLQALDIPAVALPSLKTDKRLEYVDLTEVMKRFE